MMQDQLARLEEELREEDRLGREEKSNCGTFRREPRIKRHDLMEEIKFKLTEYRTEDPLASEAPSKFLF